MRLTCRQLYHDSEREERASFYEGSAAVFAVDKGLAYNAISHYSDAGWRCVPELRLEDVEELYVKVDEGDLAASVRQLQLQGSGPGYDASLTPEYLAAYKALGLVVQCPNLRYCEIRAVPLKKQNLGMMMERLGRWGWWLEEFRRTCTRDRVVVRGAMEEFGKLMVLANGGRGRGKVEVKELGENDYGGNMLVMNFENGDSRSCLDLQNVAEVAVSRAWQVVICVDDLPWPAYWRLGRYLLLAMMVAHLITSHWPS